ncbi:MAG TPA: 3-phosphoshikimate 1-carboxyvinyltransferase [Chitinophagaceae bacterium]|nr:3-phosphoshikimate 1-carboxyvinyltransferase [Chitinophagaceae bacterium]
MEQTVLPSQLRGTITANPSKSAMQRAVAAALLSKGKSVIGNPGLSQDCLSALEAARALGATVEQLPGQVVIQGKGIDPVTGTIDCGESGLGIRMFTPIAALSSRHLIITGKGSLAGRPMDLFEELLPTLGVRCKTNHGKLPLEIQGPLQPRDIEVDGSLSSQFLTGLLMAYGAVARGHIITVKDLRSRPYIALTLQLMARFGVEVVHQDFKRFIFPREPHYHPADYTVEGDWSGAAFLLAAGALCGEISVRHLNPDSAQSDKAFLEALREAGAKVRISGTEISVSRATLGAFRFDATDCPDLFPPLVALAANCKGTSRILGVGRLAHKESDRGSVLREEFAKLGIRVGLDGDEMEVTGGPIQAGTVSSHGDHRIAMAFGIGGLVAEGPVTIKESESVNKSYPEFWDHLKELGANLA